ncbi:alpha-hydroxy-acid oxidizing protein [Staphylococcus aureus]
MAGVAHMLHMIRAEFELAMAQVGVKSLDELGPAYVHLFRLMCEAGRMSGRMFL